MQPPTLKMLNAKNIIIKLELIFVLSAIIFGILYFSFMFGRYFGTKEIVDTVVSVQRVCGEVMDNVEVLNIKLNELLF